ncbi:hypothetical protein [Amycolatopsis sp. 195334CR]|uniref:hypothetical protein n=1 Tax=Amycolatopsis sp. 195334CR TaxID=2814588 RepID=UPI001A8D981E|nr:hypothetical protein [Amycolatopsis sp. 195334CR]MBN6039120.1 hypothetical protein [Amycolatopsis sp. 195334CR]
MPFRADCYAELARTIDKAFTDVNEWCRAVEAEVQVRLGPEAAEDAILEDPEHIAVRDACRALWDLANAVHRVGR